MAQLVDHDSAKQTESRQAGPAPIQNRKAKPEVHPCRNGAGKAENVVAGTLTQKIFNNRPVVIGKSRDFPAPGAG